MGHFCVENEAIDQMVAKAHDRENSRTEIRKKAGIARQDDLHVSIRDF